MELKDVKFETVGDAAKIYPQSTLVIRKQFFDGVVARFQDTIRTRTEMLVEEQKLRVEIGQELQKEYHKTFELKEEIRKQKYRRCLARSIIAGRNANYYKECLFEVLARVHPKSEEYYFENQIQIHTKWRKLWLKASEKYKQPIEPIEKDLETL